MRKLLFTAILASLVLYTPLVKAEVPTGVFGFMDGKYYDQAQALKYLCFMDGNCYDLNTKFAFVRPQQTSIQTKPIITNYNLLTTPNAGLPHTLRGDSWPSDKDKILCSNIQENTAGENSTKVVCSNDNDFDVVVKGVTFSVPSKYNGDYDTVNKSFAVVTADGSLVDFTADQSNTLFSGTGVSAKVMYNFNAPVTVPKKPKLGGYPTSVISIINKNSTWILSAETLLVNINGEEVVYGVK